GVVVASPQESERTEQHHETARHGVPPAVVRGPRVRARVAGTKYQQLHHVRRCNRNNASALHTARSDRSAGPCSPLPLGLSTLAGVLSERSTNSTPPSQLSSVTIVRRRRAIVAGTSVPK